MQTVVPQTTNFILLDSIDICKLPKLHRVVSVHNLKRIFSKVLLFSIVLRKLRGLMGDSTMFFTPPNSTMGGLLPHFFVLKIKGVNYMLSS